MWPFNRKRTVQIPIPTGVQPEGPQPDDGYTIGWNEGKTMLKLKSGATTMTILMAPDEVHRMIRLLKASMNQDPEDSNAIPESEHTQP